MLSWLEVFQIKLNQVYLHNAQSKINNISTIYMLVENSTDDQQKKKEIVVLDPSALQYISDISLTLQDGFEVFLPDELFEVFDTQNRIFLIKLLNYWNGYKLSNKRPDFVLVSKNNVVVPARKEWWIDVN